MKTIAQIITSLAALSGLLYGTVAQATNLAELPLKSSVYIKPNVIIGLDDSGSMDWEVLIKGEQGTLQWKNPTTAGNLGTYFDATGTFLEKGGTDLLYMWPNAIAYHGPGFDAFPGWNGVPPTAQFAPLRSSAYHSLYYNPAENYAPWSPSSNPTSFSPISIANASKPVAERSVLAQISPMAPTGAKQELARTVYFGIQVGAGVRVPKDAIYRSGSSWFTAAAPFTTTGNTYVYFPYYPATYWKVESCVPVADDATCMTMPNGGTTLRRVEIKLENTTDFPTKAAYEAAMQNFANWYTYYRKRTFMLNASMGKVLESLGGMRMGVIRFNNNPDATPTMYDLDSPVAAKNGRKVASLFYGVSPNGGTPTRENFKKIGDKYRGRDAEGQPIIQYSCQRNNAFILTDGFYNYSTRDYGVPSTYNRAKYGSGSPYATTHTNTLADLALYYYTTNPRPTADTTTNLPALLGGKLAEGKDGPNKDRNTDPHINTYAMTLNVHGNMWPGITDPFASTISWPDPSSVTALSGYQGFENQPYAIDDLWHATINGRGKMYLAATAAETAKQIADGFADILSQVGSQGGVAVGSVNLTPTSTDNIAYLASYDPSGWSGDLTAHTINVNTGDIEGERWRAGVELGKRSWSSRIVVADTGASALVPFDDASVGGIVKDPAMDTATSAEVVNYLLGNREGEGTKFRRRTGLMGAAINAEPALDRTTNVVYLSTGEGMLHAFDAASGSAGKELWAFVPQDVLGAAGASPIGATVDRAYSFKTLLDGTPTITALGSGRLLVSGMGAAGRSYFALDVSNPRASSASGLASMRKWTFTDPAMGYTVGKPVVVNTLSHGRVALLTSGYDNGFSIANGGMGRLWMVNADSGALIKVFKTRAPASGESGLAQVSAFREADGNVRYAYGGDLAGVVYRFDLEATGSDLDATVVASLKDSLGRAQPVTTAPELIKIGDKRVVLVGTGRLLDTTDFGTPAFTNSFYAIADGTELSNARTALVNQKYKREATVATSKVESNPVNWATGRGWYIDLHGTEHVNTDPILAYGAVMFVTNANGGNTCDASSYLYMLDVGTGGLTVENGWVSQLISENVGASRVVTLRVVSGDLVATTHRYDNTDARFATGLGKKVPGSRNAWREVISEKPVGDTP